MKYYIKENAFPAKIAALVLRQDKMAMVLGKTILLHETSTAEFLSNRKWVRHELAHVEQFARHGYLLFVAKYILESVKNGYQNNKYEIEARKAEDSEYFDEFIPAYYNSAC